MEVCDELLPDEVVLLRDVDDELPDVSAFLTSPLRCVVADEAVEDERDDSFWAAVVLPLREVVVVVVADWAI